MNLWFRGVPYRRQADYNDYGTGLPEKVLQAFMELGNEQRVNPENAMLKVQFAMGGGVLNVMVEHLGDLTHRMTAAYPLDIAGYPYVLEKVDRGLRYLKNSYGFDREFRENVANNARSLKKDPKEFEKKLDSTLKKYVEEHKKLPVYNEAQWTAREVAISIGMKRWERAITLLEKMKAHLSSGKKWAEWAHQYTLGPNGEPELYER